VASLISVDPLIPLLLLLAPTNAQLDFALSAKEAKLLLKPEVFPLGPWFGLTPSLHTKVVAAVRPIEASATLALPMVGPLLSLTVLVVVVVSAPFPAACTLPKELASIITNRSFFMVDPYGRFNYL
jgi:hypothetical protein